MIRTAFSLALVVLLSLTCGAPPKPPRGSGDGVLDLVPHPGGVGLTYAVGSTVPFTLYDDCSCDVLSGSGVVASCGYEAVTDVSVTLPSALSLVSTSVSAPTGAACPTTVTYGTPPAMDVPATVVVSASQAGKAEVGVKAKMSDGSSRQATASLVVVEPASGSFLITCDDPGTRLDVEPRAVEPLLVETGTTFELRARLKDSSGASTYAVGFVPFALTPASFGSVASSTADAGWSDVHPESYSLTVGATAGTGTLGFTVADHATKALESYTANQLTEIRAATARSYFTYPINAASSLHQTVVVAGMIGSRAVCFTRQAVRASSRTPSICRPNPDVGSDGGSSANYARPFFDVFTSAKGTCVIDVTLDRPGAPLTSTLSIEVQ